MPARSETMSTRRGATSAFELFTMQRAPKEGGKIRILIVDDHPIMRFGIAAIVNSTPDMETVAQAGSGEDAIDLYEEYLPDITLMDLQLPGMSGVDAIRAIMSRHPDAR